MCKERELQKCKKHGKKKSYKFFLYAISFMCSLLCHGQYRVPSYLSEDNFSSIEKYLKDSIDRLDPIEGIYSVHLERDVEIMMRNGFGMEAGYQVATSDEQNFRCAIYRSTEDIFKMSFESFDDPTRINDSEIKRVGELPVYNINLHYTAERFFNGWKDAEKTRDLTISRNGMDAAIRVTLESQICLDFETKAKIYTWKAYKKYNSIKPEVIYNDTYSLIKEFPKPTENKDNPKKQDNCIWTGTGFALGNSYVVTNQHVIDEAKTISIKGVKGDLNNGYSADVVTVDKANDIAVLKINDTRFNGFGAIPYSVSTRMADVGEDVFVLGFPLTQALGNEIKLTNGIISSRTGYQGDIATYQISAPVQPGNSGGPMFDKKGNVIGIVVAGVPGAENVGYAIKTSYLSILNESAGLNIKFPSNNTISSFPLAEKVKKIKDFVFYIECSNQEK